MALLKLNEKCRNKEFILDDIICAENESKKHILSIFFRENLISFQKNTEFNALKKKEKEIQRKTMDGGKKRIPRAEFHGIFLNFAECGMRVKRGKSNFWGKKRNFSFFCGIPQKKFFFFTFFFLIKKKFF